MWPNLHFILMNNHYVYYIHHMKKFLKSNEKTTEFWSLTVNCKRSFFSTLNNSEQESQQRIILTSYQVSMKWPFFKKMSKQKIKKCPNKCVKNGNNP